MVEDGAQLIVQGLEIRLGIVLTRGRVGMTKHGVLPLHDIGRGDVTELSLPEVFSLMPLGLYQPRGV